jgi:hypothetical protein
MFSRLPNLKRPWRVRGRIEKSERGAHILQSEVVCFAPPYASVGSFGHQQHQRRRRKLLEAESLGA